MRRRGGILMGSRQPHDFTLPAAGGRAIPWNCGALYPLAAFFCHPVVIIFDNSSFQYSPAFLIATNFA